MFTSSHTSLLLEYLRVPVSYLEVESRSSLFELAAPNGRQLSWPVRAAPSAAPNRRLGDLRFFAETAGDDEARALLPPGTWEPAEPVLDETGAEVAHVWREAGGSVFLPFSPDAALLNLWSEAYQAGARSAGAKRLALMAYYRIRPLLPRAVQIALRRQLARIQVRTAFPRWPVETAAHDLYDFVLGLLGEVAGEPAPWLAPWPEPYRWALVLTHDVEHQKGCDNVALLRDIELRHGLRSAWNFVPRRYETPEETIRDLHERGFEVGVHGLYHDGRDLESREVLLERLPAMHDAAQRWGATGFRSPATHRGWDLMPLLGFEYDSSYFDTDPIEPQGGGSCTWWPFPIGDLVELPITLLMDHTLFVILRRDESVWTEKARFLREHGGMALLITHPDYLLERERLDVYDRFLETFAGDETMWAALPRDVAGWWRRRAASTVERGVNGEWRVAGPGAGDARVELGPAGGD
ncbi:MAG: hypothetical protein QOH95_2883 [Gaiellaceae bacterium]|nr:hypothetical protein [Gaiellaceae bacterium]